MTGQRTFSVTPETLKRLRQYLDRGGTMIVDDVVGSSEFDAAFRKEIKEIY
ncbi:MAG: hypothetical protein JWO87_2275, partial [Phycisphaerales bacterium]|nr:hypothetical protein [Phycisphaerales bacterium]